MGEAFAAFVVVGLGVRRGRLGADRRRGAMFVVWPNPLTYILAVMLIGARQLGLAILMHDAAHGALHSNTKINDWVGEWLCAAPVGARLESYRAYHLKHHRFTEQPEDPDLALSAPFPITRKSLWRKIVRDLTGQTFLKQRGAQLFGGRKPGEVVNGSNWRFLLVNAVPSWRLHNAAGLYWWAYPRALDRADGDVVSAWSRGCATSPSTPCVNVKRKTIPSRTRARRSPTRSSASSSRRTGCTSTASITSSCTCRVTGSSACTALMHKGFVLMDKGYVVAHVETRAGLLWTSVLQRSVGESRRSYPRDLRHPRFHPREHARACAEPCAGVAALSCRRRMWRLWEMTEEQLGELGLPPPFWAFAWAGGQALARYVLDHILRTCAASACWMSLPVRVWSPSPR